MSDIGTPGLLTYLVFLILFILMSITFLVSTLILILEYRKKNTKLSLLNAFGIVKASLFIILISFLIITLMEYFSISTLGLIDDLSVFVGVFLLILTIWYGVKYPKWLARK